MNDKTKTPEQIEAERAEAERVEAERLAAEQAEAEQAAAGKAGVKGKAEPKAPPPAWQLPGYAGPLDINQAQWRQRNIKPEPAPKSK